MTLTSSQLDGWLATQPETTRAWVASQQFHAAHHSQLGVPGTDGATALVLCGVLEPLQAESVAHLPMSLPAGDYRLAGDSPTAIDPATAALGWGLGAYQFDRYRKIPRAPARLCVDGDGMNRVRHLLAACGRVRDLVNTPTEDMGPVQLEAVVRDIAKANGARFNSIVGDELLAQNFPTIHAVGRASHRAPRLIELNWGDDSHPRLTLVGKGVCFDTGGLNIKGGSGMRKMKKDMGGSAHAIALAELIMAENLPIRLRLLVPAVENSIAGNAFRPGDVITTRAGISVEIDNTDAEGRLVLCDALTYAAEQPTDLILDFATLTGAARVALGPELPALYSNRDTLLQQFAEAARDTADPLWPMPLWTPYLRYLDSGIADLANSSGTSMGGSITAALYLQRFVPDDRDWCHFDVYAWNDGERPGHPAGGEAQALRASFAWVESNLQRR
ncbi:MAG: leucyl aminopeptidase family protein [Lysobacteraceae bacterium]